MNLDRLPELIRFSDSAPMLGLTPSLARNLIALGKIQQVTIGGDDFIVRDSAAAYLATLVPAAYR